MRASYDKHMGTASRCLPCGCIGHLPSLRHPFVPGSVKRPPRPHEPVEMTERVETTKRHKADLQAGAMEESSEAPQDRRLKS